MIAILPFLLFAAQGDAAAAAGTPAGREQVFIAPSGEPFRVAGDAPYPVAQWFSGADKNGDGKVSRNEWLKDCPCFDVRDWLAGNAPQFQAR